MLNKKSKIIIFAVCIGVLIIAISLLVTAIAIYYKDKNNDKKRSAIFNEYYLGKLEKYNEENLALGSADVVFLGDSLTDGCNLETYYSEYNCVNRGISGDTAERLKNRLEVSAYELNPKVIILLIGGNDILSGKKLEKIYENYEIIAQSIKENLPNTKVIWCSLTAMGNKWAKFNNTAIICNQQIKLLAQKYEFEFIDLFTPLCNVATGEIFEEYTYEGVHLLDSGYLVVSSLIKESLEQFIA